MHLYKFEFFIFSDFFEKRHFYSRGVIEEVLTLPIKVKILLNQIKKQKICKLRYLILYHNFVLMSNTKFTIILKYGIMQLHR